MKHETYRKAVELIGEINELQDAIDHSSSDRALKHILGGRRGEGLFGAPISEDTAKQIVDLGVHELRARRKAKQEEFDRL